MVAAELIELAVIPGLWTGYFLLHSWLASAALKERVAARWPALSRVYRLLYNALAIGLLVPILGYTASVDGRAVLQWSGPWSWVATAVLVISLVGAVLSSRAYDMVAFIGLRRDAHMPFAVSGVHRTVRHPWYFFALCILWTRDMNVASLVQTVTFTLYFIIGSRLEERRLVASFGEAYRLYRRLVPGLVPIPGRYVSAADLSSIHDALGVD